MTNMIFNSLLSITLFISGGHVLSSNFKLHHYSDEDYKDIFFMKNYDTVTKNCTRHAELENIKKIRSQTNGVDQTIYRVTKNEYKDSSQKNLEE